MGSLWWRINLRKKSTVEAIEVEEEVVEVVEVEETEVEEEEEEAIATTEEEVKVEDREEEEMSFISNIEEGDKWEQMSRLCQIREKILKLQMNERN